jgi:hypothetical protein
MMEWTKLPKALVFSLLLTGTVCRTDCQFTLLLTLLQVLAGSSLNVENNVGPAVQDTRVKNLDAGVVHNIAKRNVGKRSVHQIQNLNQGQTGLDAVRLSAIIYRYPADDFNTGFY